MLKSMNTEEWRVYNLSVAKQNFLQNLQINYLIDTVYWEPKWLTSCFPSPFYYDDIKVGVEPNRRLHHMIGLWTTNKWNLKARIHEWWRCTVNMFTEGWSTWVKGTFLPRGIAPLLMVCWGWVILLSRTEEIGQNGHVLLCQVYRILLNRK